MSVLIWAKGRARHIPTQIYVPLRFAPEHAVLFWGCHQLDYYLTYLTNASTWGGVLNCIVIELIV